MRARPFKRLKISTSVPALGFHRPFSGKRGKRKKKKKKGQRGDRDVPGQPPNMWWAKLAEPAQYKRILSCLQFWFGHQNLASDDFILKEMVANHGWMPISALMTFPRMKWAHGRESLVVKALMTEGVGDKKYEVCSDPSEVPFCCDEGVEDQRSLFKWDGHSVVAFRPLYFGKIYNEVFGKLMDGNWETKEMGDDDLAKRDSDKDSGRNQVGDDVLIDLDEDEDEYEDDDRRVQYRRNWEDAPEDNLRFALQLLQEVRAVSTVDTDLLEEEELLLDPDDDHALDFESCEIEAMDRWELVEAIENLLPTGVGDAFVFTAVLKAASDIKSKGGRRKAKAKIDADADENKETNDMKGKQADLVPFEFNGSVQVCQTYKQAETTLQRLLQELRGKGGGDGAGDGSVAICGFDVEFCSLESDIRSLPAMVQFATETRAVLIWLDKLPMHGKLIFEEVPSFGELLGDEKILKAGCGSTKDAQRLLEWCSGEWGSGISEVKGVVELAGGPKKVGLQDLCSLVLKKSFPKRKHTGKKQSKESKKAYWRAPTLTSHMRQYAVDDVAVAVSVWHEQNGADEHLYREQGLISGTPKRVRLALDSVLSKL